MAQNGQRSNGTASQALRRMAEADPELAARLVVQSLPASAATLPAGFACRIELEELGAWRVRSLGDRAEVTEVRLREVLIPRKTTITYVYDFGDDWEHRLIPTNIRQGEPGIG